MQVADSFGSGLRILPEGMEFSPGIPVGGESVPVKLQLFPSGLRVAPSLHKHLALNPSTFTQMSPQLRELQNAAIEKNA